LWVVEDDDTGREYYRFIYKEYDELLNILTEVKRQIEADDISDSQTINLINSAISYLTYHGELKYIGALKTWNGLAMSLELSATYDYSGNELVFIDLIKISANNNNNVIMIRNTETETSYTALVKSYSYVYSVIKSELENQPDLESWVLEFIDNFAGKDQNSIIENGSYAGYNFDVNNGNWLYNLYISVDDSDHVIQAYFSYSGVYVTEFVRS